MSILSSFNDTFSTACIILHQITDRFQIKTGKDMEGSGSGVFPSHYLSINLADLRKNLKTLGLDSLSSG
jgi:hypothetical protein